MEREEIVRIVGAVLDDAREAHRLAFELADVPIDGHSSLTEIGKDIDCMRCGHINEAEYMLAVLGAA